MPVKQIVILLFLSSVFIGNAQVDPKIITSPIYKNNKPRIYMEKMLGEVNGAYYVLYSTEPVKTSTLPTLYLGMLDITDMHLIKSKKLITDSPNNASKYKNLLLEKYLLTRNGLLFFFDGQGENGYRDIYLGTFDLNLSLKKDFEKVLTYDPSEREFVGLTNNNYPNIVLTTLNLVGKDETQFIEYKFKPSWKRRNTIHRVQRN